MTKITKEAFYCALAIGILGTYNSIFEAKAAAAPGGAVPVAPAALPAAPAAAARVLPEGFGMVRGGKTYEDVLDIINGRIAATEEVRREATAKRDEVTTALQTLSHRWANNAFSAMTPGLTKEEVIYEVLNWPDPEGADGAINAKLKDDERAYLLNPDGDNTPTPSSAQIIIRKKISLKIGTAISNFEKAKIFDMKVQRKALEDMLTRLDNIDRQIITELEALERALNDANNEANTEENTKAFNVFNAKLAALENSCRIIQGKFEELRDLGLYSGYYEDTYNRLKGDFEREDRAAIVLNRAQHRIFKMSSPDRLYDNIIDRTKATKGRLLDRLYALLNTIAIDFHNLVGDTRLSVRQLLKVSKKLSEIAQMISAQDQNHEITPLYVFCGMKFFEALNRYSAHMASDPTLKKQIWDNLVAEVKPGAGGLDWDADEMHRRYVIPEPSRDNGFWDPQLMRNLSSNGEYHPGAA